MRTLSATAGLLIALLPWTVVKAEEASPYVVGTWEFKQKTEDTDFKFVNPMNLNLRLEYAFFSDDGTKFCGCDADTFEPNKTVEYTMAAEIAGNLFRPGNWPGSTFGALKSIAFTESSSTDLALGEALQVGFQERLRGRKMTSLPSPASRRFRSRMRPGKRLPRYIKCVSILACRSDSLSLKTGSFAQAE